MTEHHWNSDSPTLIGTLRMLWTDLLSALASKPKSPPAPPANPLSKDPIWHEADRQEHEARAKHRAVKPFQDAKAARVRELLAGN